MNEYKYTIRLASDAEPGTGLGSELVNDFVPRDHRGQPTLPASHLKGLMRSSLVEITQHRSWGRELVDQLFGKAEFELPDENSAFSITAATAEGETTRPLWLARTEIGEAGIAVDKSLRTTEAIAVDTCFRGKLYSSAASDSVEDLSWRLALLSVNAVGGNRNRGAGACVLKIESESRSPGTLLKILNDKLSNWKANGVSRRTKDNSSVRTLKGPTVVMRVVFRATTPICCPEIADRSNLIQTGFSIPASTLQGALLTNINEVNPALATALFEHSGFRAWPLQPVDLADSTRPLPESAMRVSLTHRAAKFSVNADDEYGPEDFHDEAIEPRRSEEDRVKGAPLKGTDGVLRRETDGTVSLWRASDMPHLITSHGVHAEELSQRPRNLFTVDSMVPLVWQGLIMLPEDAVKDVQAIVSALPQISIGKSRTVRGHGKLSLEPIMGIPSEWQCRNDESVWIVQSPIAIQAVPSQRIQEVLKSKADRWVSAMEVNAHPYVWANNGILFGFNRTRGGWQEAQRVILPGSVINFRTKIDDNTIHTFFTGDKFLPEMRQAGFGAMSVHPGKATELFKPLPAKSPMPPAADNFADAVKLVLEISRLKILPNVSQIRHVRGKLANGGVAAATDYLKKQTSERTQRIWSDWEHCISDINKLLTNYSACSVRALDVLADLVTAKKQEED